MDLLISKTAFTPGLGGKASADKSTESAALWQSVLSWRALATALGLNEEVERKTRKTVTQPFCWWAQCTEAPGKEETYKRCSGCKAVSYCSAEHQRKDWKDGAHKEVCAILQNA